MNTLTAIMVGGFILVHSWYSSACCEHKDCRHIDRKQVELTSLGYKLKWLGEVVPYASDKLKRSNDGGYDWCECSYCPSQVNQTRCLYVPGGEV